MQRRDGQMEISTGHNSLRRRGAAWTIAATIIAGVSAFGIYQGVASSEASAELPAASEPVIVEAIGETEFSRLILSPSAIKRLDLQTALVRSANVDGSQRIVVPYAAVLYDPDGATWVYKTSQPRTFIRHPITIDHVAGTRAVLKKGPSAGTRVATVGAQELFGAEHGVGASSGH
jgi:hypothetical protein